MSGMTVRDALPADAAAIARVHVRSWQSGYRGLVDDAFLDRLEEQLDTREESWRQILARDDRGSYTLIAEQAGAVGGFCSVSAPSRDDDAGASSCEVAAIYVDPGAWRRGIGGALLGTALLRLRRDGWHDARLWVFAANERARAFYAGFGFAPDGHEHDDHSTGLTTIRLRLALGQDGAD